MLQRMDLQNEFSKLLANIRLECGERIFFSEPKLRGKNSSNSNNNNSSNSGSSFGHQGQIPMLHKSDGIILQPNSKYQFGGDEALLKWKWTDLRSVDLLVIDRGLQQVSL